MTEPERSRIGRPPITKYPVTLTCRVTAEMDAELNAASRQLNMTVADIVRECLDAELPDLIDRHSTKRSRATN